MAARRQKLSAQQRGAEVLFVRLAELAELTSRNINVLTLDQGELVNTGVLGEYYEKYKELNENLLTTIYFNSPGSSSQIFDVLVLIKIFRFALKILQMI